MNTNAIALDALKDFDDALATWANAYPEKVFPEPDLAKAAKLLEAGGMTLDAISASSMRHIAKTMHADFADCRAAIAALEAERLAAQSAPTGLTEMGWIIDAATKGELAAYDQGCDECQ